MSIGRRVVRGTTPNLRDAVDVHVLQRIQDTFAKAMGFAAVTVDQTGQPVTRPSSFLEVCWMIRAKDSGMRRCMHCDAEAGLEAKSRGAPYVYTCAGGLIDMAAPIIIQGHYMGCMLCGQVLPAGAAEEHVELILERNASLGIPVHDLQHAAHGIPIVARERIEAAAEMLFQMSNYIVEMGVANLMQARLLDEVRERAALQTALQQAQLRMLQSQINPHFLFNALGLLSYTASQENARKTEEIAYNLSDLLRYSLRNISLPVTLGQELEVVEHYLEIQKMRFASRLDVQVDADPSLHSTRVPSMIIQPLVENAIVHAVEPLARTVIVHVKVTAVDDSIRIEVSDDGAGMSGETLQAIRRRQFKSDAGRSALGLRNVMQRLELEFGDRCDFHIESEEGRGTVITLTLPAQGITHC